MTEDRALQRQLPSPETQHLAVFLDVDGTLLDIQQTPEAVTVPPELILALDTSHRALSGALALISGRGLAELDRLFAPLVLPAAGLHGLEMRSNGAGSERMPKNDPALAAEVTRLREELAPLSSVLVEDKGSCVALHYRQAPAAEAEVVAAAQTAAARLGTAYHVLAGKMVCEVKPKAMNKGHAVEIFMAEPPFAGRHPVYIGDDVTDEDAFVMVNRLGGTSARVGNDSPTEATTIIADVEALRDWLASLASPKATSAGTRDCGPGRGHGRK